MGAGSDSEDTTEEPCAGGLCTPVVDLRPSVVVRLASNGKWDAMLRALGTGRYPVNAPWDCNATVLHHAAWAGNAHVVAATLALGADPDSRDEDRRTTLHYACEGSDDGVRACVLRAHGSPGVGYGCGACYVSFATPTSSSPLEHLTAPNCIVPCVICAPPAHPRPFPRPCVLTSLARPASVRCLQLGPVSMRRTASGGRPLCCLRAGAAAEC